MNNFNNELEKMQPELFKRALYLEKYNRENAEDLVQRTMVRALIKQDKFVVGSNQIAWAKTIMFNMFRDDCRKNKTTPSFIDIDDLDHNPKLASNESIDTELSSPMVLAIKRLNKECQDLVILHSKQNTTSDTARKLHLPESTTHRKLTHCLKRLGEELLYGK